MLVSVMVIVTSLVSLVFVLVDRLFLPDLRKRQIRCVCV